MNSDFLIDCIKNTKCVACDGENLHTVLDLGDQPLANSYHQGEKLTAFPLKLNLCTDCCHLQLSHTVNPDLMFKNYLYVSGTTKTLRDYFDDFAKLTVEYVPDAKKVLDIACNDATQLDSYKRLGVETYGIDPAENLYDDAVAKGHNIICDYFNTTTVHKFKEEKFDIITAQNVFAHTKYTLDFLKSCDSVLSKNGKIFIQTSQSNLVVNNEFDTVYHEHISFFNIQSMESLVNRAGLHLNDVRKTSVHGTSYVFVISRVDEKLEGYVKEYNKEKENGLYDVLKYPEYAMKCWNVAYSLKKELENLKNEGYLLVGYGAAAKGNTLLNFTKIKLDLIIDDNPLKQGLLTPGMNIEIFPASYLRGIDAKQKVAFIPLAWNFFDEICERIRKERESHNDIYVRYFPSLKISKSVELREVNA